MLNGGFLLSFGKYRQDEKEKHILGALKMDGLSKEYLPKDPFSLRQGDIDYGN